MALMKLQSANLHLKLCFKNETEKKRYLIYQQLIEFFQAQTTLFFWLGWTEVQINGKAIDFLKIIIIIPASNYRKSVHKNVG